ncbi:rhomboid family intramembrane serine protease [Oceanobacillus sp. CFH 90083]|uniref:rhomboid family intramembrane serine protease n=1 Tax=Oceanobacillus sp. CFH 90083 TaxID=2592336 RepID=UPI00128BE987|nr:rhomboid family intramembrane serine protease [Oceanobacillus sp. CFH 90083]
MFIRTERSIKEFFQLYPVVTIIVGINILLWFIIDFLSLRIGATIRDLGLGVNFWIGLGEWWRIFTPIFLHAGVMHMLFNSFSLVLFGPALEQMLGKVKFILAYIGTAATANVGIYFIESPSYAHLGASGAIFGLFGIYVYMLVFRQDLIDQSSRQIIGVIVVIALIMTFVRSNISVLGHLFGFFSGFIYAPLLLAGVKSYSPWARPRPRKRKYADDDNSPQFDPNRWNKKKKMPDAIRKNMLWIIVGIIAILWLLGQANIL